MFVKNEDALASKSDRLIREGEAALLIDHSVSTLRKWRVQGGGPSYVKISRRSIRYRYSDLMGWIDSRIVRHSSEAVR